MFLSMSTTKLTVPYKALNVDTMVVAFVCLELVLSSSFEKKAAVVVVVDIGQIRFKNDVIDQNDEG